MSDISRQIFDRQAAETAGTAEQRERQTSRDLAAIKDLQQQARQLLEERNYPFDHTTGLNPVKIVHGGQEIAAWHLAVPDDEGYYATSIHLTFDGQLAHYRELFTGSFHTGSRRSVGHEYILFDEVIRTKNAIGASLEAANILERLRHLVTILENIRPHPGTAL